MVANLSEKVKLDLFERIKAEPNAFGERASDLGYIPFLSRIWNLRTLPSQDPRFDNAYGDIIKHTVNNLDWDEDYLFLDRLKLTSDNAAYSRFIETVVHPEFRKVEDEIVRFVLLINSFIEKEGFVLAVSDIIDGMPIYVIHTIQEVENQPIDIAPNTIDFIVVKKPNGRSDRSSSLNTPKKVPCFVLSFNSGWNDYDVQSEFTLFYYNESSQVQIIGSVKIMHEEDVNTSAVIDNRFKTLPETFCSLGQSQTYYKRLKDLLGKDIERVLFALKDAAFFSDIHEKFEKTTNFITSLIRNDEAERLLRTAKYLVYGYDLSNLYSFKYAFKPAFATNTEDVEFEFDTESRNGETAIDLPNRIYALIGKNGTGKTQLITSLPLNISQKTDSVFSPKTPLFSKVIAVSYSVFDKFEIPRKTSSFNYIYCGLRNDKNGNISEQGLLHRFYTTWKKVKESGRVDKWRTIILNFIDEHLIDEFLTQLPDNKITSLSVSYELDYKMFTGVRKKLSSGQNIILYIITEIIAYIRYDSLLLYDEPETHLHPNAITQLMNTIYELVDEFKSYCIIATHSPLVIRELLSKNVYVIDRAEETVSVRKIGIESFGENLSTLTDEVFGNRDIPKQYKKIIRSLLKEGKNYNEVVALLQSDDAPLSLNTRLYIKSQLTGNEES